MVGASQLLAEISPFISPVLEMKKQNISPQPKVIKFRDAVHRPGEFIFCFVAMFLMGVFVLIIGRLITNSYSLHVPR